MLLEAAALTTSGRPVLEAREVELFTLDKVDFEFDGPGGVQEQLSEAYKDGYVVLTSRRVIWLRRRGNGSTAGVLGSPCWLPLESVQSAERRSKMALSGSKVRLHLQVSANYERRPVNADGAFHRTCEVKLRCRGDAPDAFLTKLLEAQRAHRTRAAAAAAATQPESVSASPRPPPPPELEASKPPPPQQQQPGEVDEALLSQLVDMGFPRNRSARALLATSNAGCMQAVDYMLAFGEQPGMDEPLASPQAQAQPTPHAAHGHAPYGYAAAGADGVYPAAPQPYPSVMPQAAVPVASAYGCLPAYGHAPGQAYPPGPGYPPAPQPYGATLLQPHGWAQPYAAAAVAQYGAAGVAAAAAAPTAQNPTYGGGGGPTAPPAAPPVAGAAVGVAGIVLREEQKAERSERTVSAATRDLAALMAMAGDMVALAERFRGVTAARGQGDEDVLMDVDTQSELIAMGIASPVTKESAGSRYAVELSRQLADFLEKPLAASGGILTLPDVYCLYNRARGTELVSPDDLLESLKLFAKLGLPLSLRRLTSGLLVVQSSAHSEAAVCRRIAQLVAPRGAGEDAVGGAADASAPHGAHLGPAIGATDVARALSTSLPIAREHLLMAEQRGVLCRDDGPDGLRFYHNFFPAVPQPAR